jgi:hypothetical protein
MEKREICNDRILRTKRKKKEHHHHEKHIPLPNEKPNRRRNPDGNTYIPLLSSVKTRILSRVCVYM